MRFCSLGSGSSGNASLIEATSGGRTSRVLIDCGFSQRELAQRLARAGTTVDAIDAIFITHEHGDHIGCAVALARRHRIALWMSRGTWRAIQPPRAPVSFFDDLSNQPPADLPLHFARDGDAIEVGNLRLTPYTVPHDACEPLQLVCDDGDARLGVLTDAGSSTEHIVEHLQRCDALLLECNHDADLLAASAYPASLKARIGGRLGHLSNACAAQILARAAHPALRHVVAAHLSERNNTPALARAALRSALGDVAADEIPVADPALGSAWFSLR